MTQVPDLICVRTCQGIDLAQIYKSKLEAAEIPALLKYESRRSGVRHHRRRSGPSGHPGARALRRGGRGAAGRPLGRRVPDGLARRGRTVSSPHFRRSRASAGIPGLSRYSGLGRRTLTAKTMFTRSFSVCTFLGVNSACLRDVGHGPGKDAPRETNPPAPPPPAPGRRGSTHPRAHRWSA